ncbi:peptidoglycan-binding protein [Scytonema hofmannii PCC 7110]|jgi:peptidoglycan hydrolase-like protein with peptidoglycan-binding domain|uniref:Peptidoglycan-binding protein n=1 Tax=Scytonema hofmannii PCC 7110 TaxID=128403 RepID=A0A139XHB8_9CYAN|nr:peptidoglycan-binding domain-containing protein [Scytonema hofmannii]KYC44079.1 peptidoglycan-binding protein [Scytonema hofmannii PCC 7110]
MSQQHPSILSRGAQGPEVERLQGELTHLGYDLGSAGVDGIFGEYTEKAVIAFQKDNNITVDGIVGPETGKTLGARLAA